MTTEHWTPPSGRCVSKEDSKMWKVLTGSDSLKSFNILKLLIKHVFYNSVCCFTILSTLGFLYPGFINKCIQLFETTVVRHGLMLVGPTGSGKTKVGPLIDSGETKLR